MKLTKETAATITSLINTLMCADLMWRKAIETKDGEGITLWKNRLAETHKALIAIGIVLPESKVFLNDKG